MINVESSVEKKSETNNFVFYIFYKTKSLVDSRQEHFKFYFNSSFKIINNYFYYIIINLNIFMNKKEAKVQI